MAAAAMERSKGFSHPLFAGQCAMWRNILVRPMSGMPIRFYTGDTVTISNNDNLATTTTVTAGTNIDRALLLGGQALAQAFAASDHGGMPFFWKEKTFDHDDKRELLIGAIQGISKVRWAVDQGDGSEHFTDHGVVAIDTAVKIIGARK